MAINTENERRFKVMVLPAPDGTIDDSDRRHKAWSYPSSVAMSDYYYCAAAQSYLAGPAAAQSYLAGAVAAQSG